MNPSRYQLPQFVSDDRRRARADSLRLARRRYVMRDDDPEGKLPEGFARLPGTCTTDLPSEATFPSARLGVLAWDRLWSFFNSWLAYGMSWFIPLSSARGYRTSFRVLRGPKAIMSRWAEDIEFGRQRLAGVDPMHLRVARDPVPRALWEMAKRVLEYTRHDRPIADLHRKGRIFVLDYSRLWHPRIQGAVNKKGVHLAAPTCLFWSDDTGNLVPLAIQLKPSHIEAKNPVFTPLDPHPDWMMARAHVQAAHTHVHEGTYHLLETHLVSGAVALGLYRQVHPDHPLRQLLDPHYEHTLAINRQALGDLLAVGGTIDTGLAAGVAGTLDAARLCFATWKFPERSLLKDLEARGVDDDDALPVYPYRDDAKRVRSAIKQYVEHMLELWYRKKDEFVAQDTELQAWLEEVADPDRGNVPGFPAKLDTVEGLVELVTELIFRAGPQHAAVNNGQFDTYGWIPNSPGLVASPLPDTASPEEGHFTEQQFWEALPSRERTLAQTGMVWVLSTPTTRSLVHSGEAPAFHPALLPKADQIIGGFRRQLHTISELIERRNATLDVPYIYLDPMNISRSTDI